MLPSDAASPAPVAAVPLEDVPPAPAEPPPLPPPPPDVDEGGIGAAFDEPVWNAPDLTAQHVEEGAPAAAEPASPRATRTPSRARGGLLALLGILVLAAAGWGAWLWWSGRAPASGEIPAAAAAGGNGGIVLPPPSAEPEAEAEQAPPVETAAAPPPATATAPPEVVAPAATPAPAAAPDPQRARYQRMAEAYAREGAGVAYAIQLELVCQTDSVARALAAGEGVWFVPIEYRGRACFRVFWGRFGTREAAEEAKSGIPAELRGSGPVVVQPREILR